MCRPRACVQADALLLLLLLLRPRARRAIHTPAGYALGCPAGDGDGNAQRPPPPGPRPDEGEALLLHAGPARTRGWVGCGLRSPPQASLAALPRPR